MKKVITLLASLILLASCGASGSDYRITERSTFDDFKGKPTVIVYAGTYCPHCQEEVPQYEEKIWNNYKDTANLWIQTIDKKDFETTAAQGFNPLLDYQVLSGGETCDYVPSFIVLNENIESVLTSCGGEKTLEEMEEQIQNILNN